MSSILKQRIDGRNSQSYNTTLENYEETVNSQVIQDISKNIRDSVMDNFKEKLLRNKNDSAFQNQVRQFINSLLEQDLNIAGNLFLVNKLTEDIYNDILGFGPIQPLLEDEDITEIMVSKYNKIYVERKGILQLEPNVFFDSEEHLQNTIQKIVQPMGQKVDEAEPICDTSLPDGSRFNCTLPPASPDGATMTIRKFSKHKMTAGDYLEKQSLNEDMIRFLDFAVKGKANIIVSGGTGTGKTTLLNMISNFIPDTESIVTIEDTLELQLQKSNVRRLLTRRAVNGTGEITIRRLVKNTLRMRPDRIDVGEIRSGEIYDLLDALSSGHDGGMGTIHSKSPRHLVDTRIPILMGMSDIQMEVTAQKKMIASAIDLIVQIKRYKDGTRKIVRITEVCGYGEEGAETVGTDIVEDKIYLRDIFEFKKTGYVGGKIQGKYVATGNIPTTIIEKAAIYDSQIDLDIFKSQENQPETQENQPENKITESPFFNIPNVSPIPQFNFNNSSNIDSDENKNYTKETELNDNKNKQIPDTTDIINNTDLSNNKNNFNNLDNIYNNQNKQNSHTNLKKSIITDTEISNNNYNKSNSLLNDSQNNNEIANNNHNKKNNRKNTKNNVTKDSKHSLQNNSSNKTTMLGFTDNIIQK